MEDVGWALYLQRVPSEAMAHRNEVADHLAKTDSQDEVLTIRIRWQVEARQLIRRIFHLHHPDIQVAAVIPIPRTHLCRTRICHALMWLFYIVLAKTPLTQASSGHLLATLEKVNCSLSPSTRMLSTFCFDARSIAQTEMFRSTLHSYRSPHAAMQGLFLSVVQGPARYLPCCSSSSSKKPNSRRP